MSVTRYSFQDFKCHQCQKEEKKLTQEGKNQILFCVECRFPMARKVKSGDIERFQPFWSDTMQMHIHDRQDLAKLRAYAKSKGLINIGHQNQKPDRMAIRYNYEND